MQNIGQTQRAKQDRICCSAELEVISRVDNSGTLKARGTNADRFDSEAHIPALTGGLQYSERRLDDFQTDAVTWQAYQIYVDHFVTTPRQVAPTDRSAANHRIGSCHAQGPISVLIDASVRSFAYFSTTASEGFRIGSRR
jgi:hypothetical protein